MISSREQGKYWLKHEGEWIDGYWDGHCWEDYGHFGLQDSDYDEVGPPVLDPDAIQALKVRCWTDAYMAGMEYGHHWTVEGGYVSDDEEAAQDYVNDRLAESES